MIIDISDLLTREYEINSHAFNLALHHAGDRFELRVTYTLDNELLTESIQAHPSIDMIRRLCSSKMIDSSACASAHLALITFILEAFHGFAKDVEVTLPEPVVHKQ